MTVLVVMAAAIGGGAAVVVRALLVDEAKGHLRRRVTASVEATIAALPPEMQDEWAEEWRADLGAVVAMPLTALLYARHLRVAARELAGVREMAPEVADAPASPWSRLRRVPDRLQRSGSMRWIGVGVRTATTFSRNAFFGLASRPRSVALVGGVWMGALISLLTSATLLKSIVFLIVFVASAYVAFLFEQRYGRS